MKNVYILSCLFFVNSTSHCMDGNIQTQLWQDFDYKGSVERSINRCQEYIQNNLKEYKCTDFTSERMDKIVTDGDDKLGRSCIPYVHQAKDTDQNGFFQYAIIKRDLPRVQWLVEKGNIQHHEKKEYDDFIQFCTEQLSPSKEEKEKKRALI